MKAVDRILGEGTDLRGNLPIHPMTPYQRRIRKNPKKAFEWANHNRTRFPEAEPYIVKDPQWAVKYAAEVLEDRWPEAEATILQSQDPYKAYVYAMFALKSRWPEAEAIIATKPFEAYAYAHSLIKGRWPEAEAIIMSHPTWAFQYAVDVIGGRWPEAEEMLAKSSHNKVYLKRFPEAKWDWVVNGWIDWLDL